MSGKTQFVDAVRDVARAEARRVSPPVERWRVVKKSPLTLEDLGSDLRITDGDEDFEIAPRVRANAKVNDIIFVLTDPNGDRVAITRSLPPGEDDAPDVPIGSGLEYVDGVLQVTAGGPGSDKNYVHEQGVAAKEWPINHKLGKRPCVAAFDSTGQEIEFQLKPVDNNNITLVFVIDISGKAVLN